MTLVRIELEPPLAVVRLNDPDKRNALSLAMFDALDSAIAQAEEEPSIHVLLLTGAGRHFCVGFDLGAAVEDETLMGRYIQRLSVVMRRLRRMPAVVVAAVEGAAIAGGCALITAADFVLVTPNATLGYPVHPIGVSPAVTLPTLDQKLGSGAARAVTMGGELLDGEAAYRIGLATHVAEPETKAVDAGLVLARALAEKPPQALRVTKAWLNELDGSLDDDRFTRPADGSIELTRGEEAVRMLAAFWSKRQQDSRKAS